MNKLLKIVLVFWLGSMALNFFFVFISFAGNANMIYEAPQHILLLLAAILCTGILIRVIKTPSGPSGPIGKVIVTVLIVYAVFMVIVSDPRILLPLTCFAPPVYYILIVRRN